MKVQGRPYHTLWLDDDRHGVLHTIDQTQLPHTFAVLKLETWQDTAAAIRNMQIRGAIVIGVAAGYAMLQAAQAARQHPQGERILREAVETLKAARPTAVNLAWAVDRQSQIIAQGRSADEKVALALQGARDIEAGELNSCRSIGEHGLELIRRLPIRDRGGVVNILTHCNAGWLACVDFGTATAPMYAAHDAGVKIHVWVDETRPWNQGARLTAWELGQHGVPHTVVADNAGGHLMQHGLVDLVLVGADRVTRRGDAANKIGTYLKALAARDNGVPFYVAFPSSTFDWALEDGVKEIPIEQRGAEEVQTISGWSEGKVRRVRLTPENSPAANYGFDVTPARLITGLITERGICPATEAGIQTLFK